jgi:uncharacterized membrane protein
MIKILLSLIMFILLDMSWLFLNAKGMYANIFNDKINYLSGTIAYAVLLLNFLIIKREKTLNNQLFVAALSGFIIYSAFGLILGTFYSKYPLHVSLIDGIWGACLYSIVTYTSNKLKLWDY